MENFDAPFVNLPDVIHTHAKFRGDKLALVCGSRRVTWRELNRRFNRVANALETLGVVKGDKVAMVAGNCLEAVEIMLGAVKAGAVIVPLSAMLSGEAVSFLTNDSDARVFFAGNGLQDLVNSCRPKFEKIENFVAVGFTEENWTNYEDLLAQASDDEPNAEVAPEDEFNIIYSSGTTGTPKGIVHTHYARQHFASGLAIEFRFDSSSIALITTPIYSNGSLMMLLPALTVGATTIVMENFATQDFLITSQREKCTHTFMVPPQFVAILAQPNFAEFDLSAFRYLISAGAALRKETKAEILQRFDCGLFELYGLTEGFGTSLKPEEVAGKIASVGTPIFGADIRIIDDEGRELANGETGEIVGYAAGLMKCYHKQSAQTEAVVWRDERGRAFLKSGDIGRFDADGFLYISDRKKDMVVSGGFNIYPSDIEAVIAAHPAVFDVAVIGVPHEKWDETPLALVAKRADAEVSAEELTEWTNARLSKTQRICAVEFRDQIPRNLLGKILKKELREPYWNG